MENNAFRKFEWSVWKLLDCRILHQIPKGFWEPWAATKPPAVSNDPPLKISAYGPAYNYHVNVAALCLTAFLTFIDTHFKIYLSAEYIIQGLIIYQLENSVVIPGWTRSSALFLCRNGGLKVAVFWSTYSRRFALRDYFSQQYHLKFRIIPLQGADPEILVRGWGVDFFPQRNGVWRPP